MKTTAKSKTPIVPPRAWLVAAAIYFVFPLDGDFLFPVGYVDDALFGIWAYATYRRETKEREELTDQVAPTASPAFPMKLESSAGKPKGLLARLARAWWDFI